MIEKFRKPSMDGKIRINMSDSKVIWEADNMV